MKEDGIMILLSDGNSAPVTYNDGVLKALIKIQTKFFFIQA